MLRVEMAMRSSAAHNLSFRYREEVREMFQHAYNRSLQLESALLSYFCFPIWKL